MMGGRVESNSSSSFVAFLLLRGAVLRLSFLPYPYDRAQTEVKSIPRHPIR